MKKTTKITYHLPLECEYQSVSNSTLINAKSSNLSPCLSFFRHLLIHERNEGQVTCTNEEGQRVVIVFIDKTHMKPFLF